MIYLDRAEGNIWQKKAASLLSFALCQEKLKEASLSGVWMLVETLQKSCFFPITIALKAFGVCYANLLYLVADGYTYLPTVHSPKSIYCRPTMTCRKRTEF